MTPVLFMVFNRPDVTAQVFEAIRQAKPRRLYIAADGPRTDKPDEVEICEQVRKIATGADWDCEVRTLFSEENIGCRLAVSTAINWFFDHEEEGIILEDDCIPHPTFFKYCQELLDYYRRDNRIMVISGNNFQFGRKRGEFSYYFSRFNHCWGWATWRQAWTSYNSNMQLWPYVRDNDYLSHILDSPKSVKYWTKRFEMVHSNEVDSWAYVWTFSCWCQSGLTILPNINLVSNIGFGKDATRTKRTGKLANMGVGAMEFPIQHPPCVIRDKCADNFTEKQQYLDPWWKKLARFLIIG